MAAAGVCPCSSKCLLSHMENSSRIVSTLVQGIFASKAIDNIGDQPCIICPPWQNKCSSVHSGLENTGSYPSRNLPKPKNKTTSAQILPVNTRVALDVFSNHLVWKGRMWINNQWLHGVLHPPSATRSPLYFPPLLEINMEKLPFQPGDVLKISKQNTSMHRRKTQPDEISTSVQK